MDYKKTSYTIFLPGFNNKVLLSTTLTEGFLFTYHGSAVAPHLGIDPLTRMMVPVQSKHSTSGPALMVRSRLACIGV